MSKDKNLIDGSVLSTIVKFTIPILLSMLLQIAYGTADLFIVGQFSDVANVSGVSIGSQITVVFTNFCVGISMGTTVLIGKYLGAKEEEKAAKVVGVSVVLFSVLALVCTLIMVCFSNQIISMMQTPKESFSYARNYLIITGIGSVFIVAYNVLGSIFRGIGDSKTPLIAVAIACIINIVVDVILVAGFNMGGVGAAIATVIAQASSVVLSILIIRKKGLPFQFNKKFVKWDMKYISSILKIGSPTALQLVLSNFSFLVISAILNSMGVAASAAVGIVGKIVAFILIMPMAFGQSLSAFTAQNMGAKRMDRAKKALVVSIVISAIYGMITGYISYYHGTIFTSIFNPDLETGLAAVDYLKAYSSDCILVAFMFTFSGYFNGRGNTTYVMLNSVAAAFLIRIPISYYFSTLENPSLFMIGLAIPISTSFQIIAYLTYFKYTNKKDALLKKAN